MENVINHTTVHKKEAIALVLVRALLGKVTDEVTQQQNRFFSDFNK
jgi:hypothetical protein